MCMHAKWSDQNWPDVTWPNQTWREPTWSDPTQSDTSLPGSNELMYEVLLKLSSTHSFLATLYSWLLLENTDPSAMWYQSKIKLTYKDGDKNDPTNFRPILLTSCVGKIYHQILVDRMTVYLYSNGLIDTIVHKTLMQKIFRCTDIPSKSWKQGFRYRSSVGFWKSFHIRIISL
jgi:hypothetical protein